MEAPIGPLESCASVGAILHKRKLNAHIFWRSIHSAFSHVSQQLLTSHALRRTNSGLLSTMDKQRAIVRDETMEASHKLNRCKRKFWRSCFATILGPYSVAKTSQALGTLLSAKILLHRGGARHSV